MTDTVQLGQKPYNFLASDEEQIIGTWRFRLIAFYGSLLALLIAFAAMSQAPSKPQANLASDDFVTHYVSNWSVP